MSNSGLAQHEAQHAARLQGLGRRRRDLEAVLLVGDEKIGAAADLVLDAGGLRPVEAHHHVVTVDQLAIVELQDRRGIADDRNRTDVGEHVTEVELIEPPAALPERWRVGETGRSGHLRTRDGRRISLRHGPGPGIDQNAPRCAPPSGTARIGLRADRQPVPIHAQ